MNRFANETQLSILGLYHYIYIYIYTQVLQEFLQEKHNSQVTLYFYLLQWRFYDCGVFLLIPGTKSVNTLYELIVWENNWPLQIFFMYLFRSTYSVRVNVCTVIYMHMYQNIYTYIDTKVFRVDIFRFSSK